VSATDREFRWLLSRRGLEKLFSGPHEIQQYLDFVTARRNALRESYDPFIVSDDVGDVTRLLRAKYQQSVRIRDPVTDSYFNVDQRYVNVTIVGREGLSSRTVRPNGKPSSHHKHFRTYELGDIVSKCEQLGTTTRVNIKGVAGIGKSTVCQCLVNSWAKGELFCKFDYVLWVPLRNLTLFRYPIGKKLYSVTDVVIQECLELQSSPMLRARVEAALADKDKVLWILDGYDEIAGHIPDHLLHAFNMMVWDNRILTGRPEVLSRRSQGPVDPYIECDIELQITGFSDANIGEFVEQFVHSTVTTPSEDATARQHAVASTLLSCLQRTRAVWDLAHIPVHLVLLCHVFHNEFLSSSSPGRDDNVLSWSIRVVSH
jgi:hypothetical protein